VKFYPSQRIKVLVKAKVGIKVAQQKLIGKVFDGIHGTISMIVRTFERNGKK
jgi:hypothetical protein